MKAEILGRAEIYCHELVDGISPAKEIDKTYLSLGFVADGLTVAINDSSDSYEAEIPGGTLKAGNTQLFNKELLLTMAKNVNNGSITVVSNDPNVVSGERANIFFDPCFSPINRAAYFADNGFGRVNRLEIYYHEPLETKEVPVNPNVLVVGGGVAGIQSSLEIADSEHQLYLVEKEPSIGGHMAQFDKTFPTLDCAACILTPKMTTVGQHPYIRLMSYSEVEDVSGYVGNFKVKIRKKARYVDEDKCTGCGVCQKSGG